MKLPVPRFEDPPKSARATKRSENRSAYWIAAKKRPGKWLLVKDDAKNSAINLLPGFESTTRRNADKTFRIWIRYTGEK